MRTELENQDIDAIAIAVSERLQPLLKGNGSSASEERIFDVQKLAKYLKVAQSWVYNNVKNIPHFKPGKYIRFKKSEIDKWIESETIRPFTVLSCGTNRR